LVVGSGSRFSSLCYRQGGPQNRHQSSTVASFRRGSVSTGSTRPCGPTSSRGSRASRWHDASAPPRGAFASSSTSSRRDPHRAFFITIGQGAAGRAQGRPCLRLGHCTAQAEPLHLRHQPRLARRTATPQLGRRLPGPQGRAVCPRLPRRVDDERPLGSWPTPAVIADVWQLDLGPQHLRTRFGGPASADCSCFSRPWPRSRL
jgi:hypothetical protein